MFDLLFATTPYKQFSSEASMRHEKDLLDMAMNMFEIPRSQASFPKYNVYRMLDGSPYTYFMEFALAGYDKTSLKAKIDGDYLIISSRTDGDKKEEREYIHRGMARRDFSTKFYVGKNVEVKGAMFTNGLLTVELEKLVPEDRKARSIEIT